MNNALFAINLAIQEQLGHCNVPTRERTLRLAYQYGSRTCRREMIIEIINFDKLETLCSTQSNRSKTNGSN